MRLPRRPQLFAVLAGNAGVRASRPATVSGGFVVPTRRRSRVLHSRAWVSTSVRRPALRGPSPGTRSELPQCLAGSPSVLASLAAIRASKSLVLLPSAQAMFSVLTCVPTSSPVITPCNTNSDVLNSDVVLDEIGISYKTSRRLEPASRGPSRYSFNTYVINQYSCSCPCSSFLSSKN